MTYIPGGGGGSGSISTSSDVALNNPITGHALVYDAGLAKWKNASSGSSAVPIKVETAGRTLDLSDTGAYIYVEGSADKTYVMPMLADGAPPVGSTVTVRRGDGTGAVTVTATTTDYTIQAFHPLNKGNIFSLPENGTITLIHFRSNAWAVEGIYA